MIRKPQISLFFQWSEHKIGNELQKMSDVLYRHPEFIVLAHADLTSFKKDTGSAGDVKNLITKYLVPLDLLDV